MDPISAIFVMTVLGGLFAKGVDVATDGIFSAEVGAGVRGVAGYAGRDVRDRWGRANEKAREIRSRTRSGRMVQGILDDAGVFGRTGWMVGRVLFGEARRFGSGARSEWETARDQARSARTERRGDEPWPIVRAARSGAVRAREWAERRAGSGADVPNEPEPNDPNGDSGDIWGDPPVTGTAPEPGMGEGVERGFDHLGPLPPKCPDCGMPIVLPNGLADHRMGRDRCHYADMDDDPEPDPDGNPNVTPEPGVTGANPARQPARVEFYRAYVERGALRVRASLQRLDADTSYAAVKDHGERSTQRGWTTVHETGWLPSMPDVVARVRAAVLSDLGSPPGPYRMEWFINGVLRGRDGWSDAALHEAGVVDGDPRTDPDDDPNEPNGDPWQDPPLITDTVRPAHWEPVDDPCAVPRQPVSDGMAWIVVGKTRSHCSECFENVVDYTDAETCSGCEAYFIGIRAVYPEHIDAIRAERPDMAVRLDNDPNGDPNVPLPSTVPDANGDVKCGCCARLHKPLPPGEHCPDCHIHDAPGGAPDSTTPPAPAVGSTTSSTGGSMSDATNAPAIIAAWENIANRFEAPGAEIKQIGADMAGLADSMGDFACGKEGDAVGGTQMALQALGQAYEGVQAEIQGLYDEFAASIEAAAGKGAVAHAPMQEA